MKKAIFRTYYNSKATYLFNAIIRTEDLDVTWAKVETTLGDTMIEAYGSPEDIEVLKEVYNMVS